MGVIAFLALLAAIAAAYFPLAAAQDWGPFFSSTPQAVFNTEILLDRSSAMAELLEGKTKLAAAVDAVEIELNKPYPKRSNRAFRHFGGPCEGDNTKLTVPFGQDNKAQVQKELAVIKEAQPRGATTLVTGILEAIEDFSSVTPFDDKKLGLIVITSGVDTCDTDYIEHIQDRMQGLPINVFWIITLDAPDGQAQKL